MSSPEILDLDALVGPISDDSPVGTDPRADPSPTSLYYATKDARNAARNTERQAMMAEDDTADSPDWRPVLENGKELLATVGKDLEITAYLIEALVRLHGFPGLRDGFRLAHRLIEKYFDDIFPLPDEDGLETRVAPLTGLNGDDGEGTLISPIHKVNLTDGSNFGPYAFYHYQQAGNVAQIVDEEAREEKIQKGAVSLDMFQRSVMETPSDFFQTLTEDIKEAQEAFAELSALLDEKAGSVAPPSSNIRHALEECLETVQNEARDKLAVAEAEEEQEEASSEEEASESEDGETVVKVKRSGQDMGTLQNREDAFRILLKLADFFRKNEPHSPVSFALEQIVRWGRMSLPQLLKELIRDESSRSEFFDKVGIRVSEDEEDS